MAASFRTLGMKPWFGKNLHVSHADKVFDNAGKITDVEISAQLRQFIRFYGLYRFANNQVPKRAENQDRTTTRILALI